MKYTDNTPMPFGKHRSLPLLDVPADYLIWFAEQDWSGNWPGLENYVNDNWKAIETQAGEEHREVQDETQDDLWGDRE